METTKDSPISKSIITSNLLSISIATVFGIVFTVNYAINNQALTEFNLTLIGTTVVSIGLVISGYIGLHIYKTWKELGEFDLKASTPALIGYFGSHLTSEEQESLPHVKQSYKIDLLMEQPLEDRIYEAELEGSAMLLLASRLYAGRYKWKSLYMIPVFMTIVWSLVGFISSWSGEVIAIGAVAISFSLFSVALLRSIIPRYVAKKVL